MTVTVEPSRTVSVREPVPFSLTVPAAVAGCDLDGGGGQRPVAAESAGGEDANAGHDGVLRGGLAAELVRGRPGQGDRGAPAVDRGDGDGGARHRGDRPGDGGLDDLDRGDRVRPVGVAGLAEDDLVADLERGDRDGRAVPGHGGAGRVDRAGPAVLRPEGELRAVDGRDGDVAGHVPAAEPAPAPAVLVEAHLGSAVGRRPDRLREGRGLAFGRRDGRGVVRGAPAAEREADGEDADHDRPREGDRAEDPCARSARAGRRRPGSRRIRRRLRLHVGPLDGRRRHLRLLRVLLLLHSISPGSPAGWDGSAPGAGRGHPGRWRQDPRPS